MKKGIGGFLLGGYGNTDTNDGMMSTSTRLLININPSNISGMKATVKLAKNVETIGCDNNITPTSVRSRLHGAFFNTGPATAGSDANNVYSYRRTGGMMSMDQYEYIRTAHRVYGKRVREIARETGHDRKTIRKVLRGERSGYGQRQSQPYPDAEKGTPFTFLDFQGPRG
jgi:predicted transcriptional regulator